ncbi:hypothetical protein ACOXXX_14975 [Thalassococcus sp. BH17M4-6]|uniref:sulfotransferase-like domain-containing protein n=1 Tax=Thalassococcus sp. BH17M4-6 TaxID=3413148 RepID=UPI003BED092F
MPNDTGLIALWAIPRSRSTALFRSLMNLPDTLFLHEPFADLMDLGYAVLPDPDAEAGQMIARDADTLLTQMLKLAGTRRVILKETLEHDYPFRRNPRLLREVQHVLLMRRVEDVVTSHLRLKPHVRVDEIGFDNLHAMWRSISDIPGLDAVVLDSDDLIADPAALLPQLCARLGLPYSPDMLSWSPGQQDVWARSAAWHKDVAKSGGFIRTPQRPPKRPVYDDPALAQKWADCVRHHTPFYTRMRAARLVAASPPSAKAAKIPQEA